jgi:putative FmdB family regulatory protein
MLVKKPTFMPTYEYECPKCGKTFELFQSMKDDPIKVCPDKKCKGKVKRLIGTGAGLIFKGSGFYITDYRSEGYKQAAKKDSGSGSEKSSASADKPKSSTPAKPSTSKE